jgi:hypothetical protein
MERGPAPGRSSAAEGPGLSLAGRVGLPFRYTQLTTGRFSFIGRYSFPVGGIETTRSLPVGENRRGRAIPLLKRNDDRHLRFRARLHPGREV